MKIEKITVGCDHAAYELKKKVIAHLEERGIEVIDVGTHSAESCDYPKFAHAVCKNVQDGVTPLGSGEKGCLWIVGRLEGASCFTSGYYG